MIICTAQMSIRDPDGLDITVKSASTPEGKALAPEWSMVTDHKKGLITDAEYHTRYLSLLRRRYKVTPGPFLIILKRQRVVLLCYCKTGAFCHRHIAVEVLTAIAQKQRIDVVSGGEVVPPTPPEQLSFLGETDGSA